MNILLLFVISCVLAQYKGDRVDLCRFRGNDCGVGWCQLDPVGNRCLCPRGRMGIGCKRPCQDVFKSCQKWSLQKKCEIKITPFFKNNCALSCQFCQSNGERLRNVLPIGLEPLAWIVGRWETNVPHTIRFPTHMSSVGYNEILEIQIADVNEFDRPTLNYSVKATSFDGNEVHNELGFIAMKPARESNGFVQLVHDTNDRVAIEMTSNTGLNVIQEGILDGNKITLQTTHAISMDNNNNKHFISAKRTFLMKSPSILVEILLDGEGKHPRFIKRFRQNFDYLKAIETDE